jgi:hypothetical protein
MGRPEVGVKALDLTQLGSGVELLHCNGLVEGSHFAFHDGRIAPYLHVAEAGQCAVDEHHV